jgi:CheY-like chemotaxis protein
LAKTILLVDDNPKIRKLLSQLLEAGTDYDVCAQATDGQEGIDLAQKFRPDLIILDLSMPVVTGMDAAKELKKLMPEVPIILFTQFPDLGKHLRRKTELPVDRIVSKSDSHALLEQVRSVLPA